MVNNSKKEHIQFCFICGKKISKDSIYCENCGLRLKQIQKKIEYKVDNILICPSCRTLIEFNSIFCSHCGKRINIIPSLIEKEKRNSNFLVDLFELISKLFSSKKMKELEKFKKLLCSNKWEEALIYYEKLPANIKNEQKYYDIISIIKANIKFPVLLFLDIESDPNNDEIWEIAAIKKRGNIEIGRFHTFIKSSSLIPRGKLSPEEYSNYHQAPNLQKALEIFDFFLADQPLIVVGHNIQFDIEHISKYSTKILGYPYIDTLELSYLCWPLYYSHTLSNLIDVEEIHRAEYDVDSNILLFNKILRHLQLLETFEKSFFFNLSNNTTRYVLTIFFGTPPPLDASLPEEYFQKIELNDPPTLEPKKHFSTAITFSDKIAHQKSMFIDIDGYLSREEFYKNILNITDRNIYVLVSRDSLLIERRNISEITGENEPSKQITLLSECLEKFCAFRFQKILQSDIHEMHPDSKKTLLYFMLWSLQTSDGILDPNLYFWMYNMAPENNALIRKIMYHKELCSSKCPLKIRKTCPTLYPRTNGNIIFTDFPTLSKSQGNHVILNKAHKLIEFMTNELIETISQEDIENLMYECSDCIDFSSLKKSLHEMGRNICDFVEGRDPFQQKKHAKTLRILEFFKKSNDWEMLHEAKNCLIDEISRMTEKIGENDRTTYKILSSKICYNLSTLLPYDYLENQYVTWFSLDYDDEQTVKNWSIKRTFIDIKKVKDTFIENNKVILISNSCNLEKNTFLLEFLDLGDTIPITRIDGLKKDSEVIISGHIFRPTQYNVLSFLSNFAELIYGLSDITVPLEIITPSHLHLTLLSRLLRNREKVKTVSQSLFESQKQAHIYLEKLEREHVKNFIFIQRYNALNLKDVSTSFTVVESIPFPNFFDPVVSARSSRYIETSKDYEKFIIPRITTIMNDILSYGKATSDHVLITDSRFITGYYAHTVNPLLSSRIVLCGDEDHFLITLNRVLPSEYYIDRQCLHQISNYLEKMLIQENITPEIDFSAIDPLIYLKSFFGHDTFRPKQVEVITHIFTEKDTLAVMPTGHGKSLCYQIPAIAFSILAEGLTVIISPLQALMRDQVRSLRDNGCIKATYINSSVSSIERTERLKGIQNGWYDIVYISPEQLRNRRTCEAIRSREIFLFVIDEAHCLSQWGHDFRPDYFHIPQFIESLPKRPRIAAFTATATEHVIHDISTTLHMSCNPFILPVKRNNLHLMVKKITAANMVSAEKKKYDELLSYLISQGRGKNGIIYCAYTRTTEKLCQFLKNNSNMIGRTPHEIEYFHGKMDNQRKSDVQDNFMKITDDKHKISLVIATNAFGMGIDKDDIHFIIHFDIPGSIEMYYQEIGRGGRNPSINADCLLLYWEGDLEKQKILIKTVTEAEIITVHDQLKQCAGSHESMILFPKLI